ncbi:MAG: tetratricopeptide repeat protein [Sandaracinaceae bacterium]|nr:tetratricopeptide repeat protein [Sandaracinaceae bacterium]
MRYLCVHCDHRFEHEGTEPPKRCPSCMRKGGLEARQEPAAAAAAGERNLWAPAAALLAVALLGGGYLLMNRSSGTPSVAGDVPMRPLSTSELRAHLVERDVTPEPFVGLFEANDAVSDLGERGVDGKSGALEQARGVVALLRERASAGAFVAWPMDVPRDTAPKLAASVAEALTESDHHLYPLEVAALAVAALRAEGVPAMLAEVWKFDGDRRPPDPSGQIGYFVVAVYEGDAGQGEPTYLDPYGGRTSAPTEGFVRVLDDTQAVAAMMSLDALYRNVHQHDGPRAMQRAEHALRLDARAPYARGVRAAVLLSSGSHQEAISELSSAAEIRADAPRRLARAGVLIATNDFDGASREIATALEEFPDYALAHAFNGLIYLQGGEDERARDELETARRLEPGLQKLTVWFAMLELESGNIPEAIGHARTAMSQAGLDPQAHIQIAQVFRQAGDFDSMRVAARRAVELTPESMRERVSALILQMLGPTALEEPDDLDDEELTDEELDEEWDEDDDFELGGGLQLGGAPGMGAPAGAAPGGATGPSLLGDDERPSAPPGLPSGPGSFQLGGGSLRLDE